MNKLPKIYVLCIRCYGDFDVPYDKPVATTLWKATAKSWVDKGSRYTYIRVEQEPDVATYTEVDESGYNGQF